MQKSETGSRVNRMSLIFTVEADVSQGDFSLILLPSANLPGSQMGFSVTEKRGKSELRGRGEEESFENKAERF